jgi:hypothetical protein
MIVPTPWGAGGVGKKITWERIVKFGNRNQIRTHIALGSPTLPNQFRTAIDITALELNTLFPASSASRKNIKLFVDSRPARSTRKWSRTARPRNSQHSRSRGVEAPI